MTPASKTALSAPSAHRLPGEPGESGLSGAKTSRADGERLRLKDGALYDEALKYASTANVVKSPARPM